MLSNLQIKQLENNFWFSQLSPSLQSFIVESAHVQQFEKEQIIFSAGDLFDGIYAVLDGSVRLAHIDIEGREAVTIIADPILWFGEISLIDQQPRSHHAISTKKSLLLKINARDIQAKLNQQPELWFHIAQMISQKLRYAFLELMSIQTQPLTQRLAQRLIFILQGYGNLLEIENNIILLSQEQLAQMLVCSRQTINQELQQLEKQGIIRVAFRKIEVIDLAKLNLLAEQN